MKRIKCPECKQFITFDEKKYEPGQKLKFTCPNCEHEFSIRLKSVGMITVVENDYHYKQEFLLRLGDNVIGRKSKDERLNCPIQTDDLDIDFTHCVISVKRDKEGNLHYDVRDHNSGNGTWVAHERLAPKERRRLEDGSLINIGGTTIILKTL